jgi:hypothetical protein
MSAYQFDAHAAYAAEAQGLSTVLAQYVDNSSCSNNLLARGCVTTQTRGCDCSQSAADSFESLYYRNPSAVPRQYDAYRDSHVVGR